SLIYRLSLYGPSSWRLGHVGAPNTGRWTAARLRNRESDPNDFGRDIEYRVRFALSLTQAVGAARLDLVEMGYIGSKSPGQVLPTDCDRSEATIATAFGMERVCCGHIASDGTAAPRREVMFWRRLKYLIPSYRRHEEREMQQELESLRAMAEHNELGNLTLAAENARAAWGWNSIDDLRQDFRYAFRTFLRHPRVTGVALLSLAFGIGVNTLVFTVVNAMMFRPMPYPQPERLVKIGS